MAKPLTDKQSSVLACLVAGRTLAETRDATNVSVATCKRWKAKFAGLLAEHDDALIHVLLESRAQSFELLGETLTALQQMLKSAESVEEKLAVVDRGLKAFALLNPQTQTPGSVTVSASQSYERTVVILPDNGRGDELVN